MNKNSSPISYELSQDLGDCMQIKITHTYTKHTHCTIEKKMHL